MEKKRINNYLTKIFLSLLNIFNSIYITYFLYPSISLEKQNKFIIVVICFTTIFELLILIDNIFDNKKEKLNYYYFIISTTVIIISFYIPKIVSNLINLLIQMSS